LTVVRQSEKVESYIIGFRLQLPILAVNSACIGEWVFDWQKDTTVEPNPADFPFQSPPERLGAVGPSHETRRLLTPKRSYFHMPIPKTTTGWTPSRQGLPEGFATDDALREYFGGSKFFPGLDPIIVSVPVQGVVWVRNDYASNHNFWEGAYTWANDEKLPPGGVKLAGNPGKYRWIRVVPAHSESEASPPVNIAHETGNWLLNWLTQKQYDFGRR
jgi:hypothetical protein